MNKSYRAVAAIASLGGAALAFGQQVPGGGPPGGLVLPPIYTNKNAPLGAVDTAAADRACTAQGPVDS